MPAIPADFLVLCFGEVLWDCLPKGLFLGGAPINVAYHLARHGLQAVPVTAVGRDFLGDEIARRFKRLSLPTTGLSVIPDKPTGAVLVELDTQGVPTYQILENVAWDYIALPAELERLAEACRALVFGTLAQRSHTNQKQLATLVQWAASAAKVFDINLRPPFDDLNHVRAWGRKADLIKLNLEELAQVLGRPVPLERIETSAAEFQNQIGCPRICVTAGAHGAGLQWDHAWHWEAAKPTSIKDTVGAGDAFLASLLRSWIVDRLPPPEALRRACRLAEFVASQEGATPGYTWSPGDGGRPMASPI